VDHPAPIDEGPLKLVEKEVPVPGPGQVRVRVLACGACRTDLHLAEGGLASRRPGSLGLCARQGQRCGCDRDEL